MKDNCVKYLRKSSESEDRQALSLPAQEDALEKLAKRIGSPVVATFQESKSAKAPGREEFNKMIEMIQSGQANTILVWHPNRLSRNSVDSGLLIYLFDLNLLKFIITPTRTYSNTPTDKMLFNIEIGGAKYENDNKSVDVKRGMTQKAKQGWYPSHCPKGYFNTPHKQMGFKTIHPDKIRFPYLKSSFYSILQGDRPIEVFENVCSRWLQDGHSDLLISRSTFYRMLSNSFYYGEFEWPKESGNWYQGKHEPLISKEIFDLVQPKVNPSQKTLRNKHSFPYKGIFFCGECGCMVSGTRKNKFIKGDGTTRSYDYYRCSWRSTKHTCKQPPLSKSLLNDQLQEIVGSIRVPTDFLSWAKKWTSYLQDQDRDGHTQQTQAVTTQISSLQTKSALLLEKLLDNLITDDEYKPAKKKISDQITLLEFKANSPVKEKKYKVILDELEFAHTLNKKFTKAKDKEQGRVVRDLGSNFFIKDKKVSIQLKNSFYTLSKISDWSPTEKDRFELTKYTDIFNKNPNLIPSNPRWLAK